MFGANKTTAFSGFGTSMSSFGNPGSTFGSSSGFGGANNAFGSTTPASGSLFGGAASGSTGTTGGGLFGSQPTTGFGQQQTGGGGFSFGTPSSSTGGGLFGGTSQASTGSLFSSTSTGFGGGANKTAFTGFGGTATPTSTGGGLFGGGTTGGTSLFGQTAGAFGSTGAAASGGTTFPFNAPTGQDTMMKNGVSNSINTKHQCITAMKEYENKSIEELRCEDYAANRKSKQATSTGTSSLFGQTPAATTSTGTGFVFGGGTGGLGTGLTSGTSTGFGGFGGTSAATTPFNQNRPLFGPTATTAQSGFGGFGSATGAQSNSLFGNTAGPLFGGTASTQPSLTGGTSFFGAPAAGTSNTTGFGTNTGTSLFGAKPGGFGTATTSSLGFGTGGNMFAKPTTTASGFGFGATNTSTTGFGATSGGLFGAKPGGFGATSTGLGGTSTFGFGGGLGAASTANTFGTNAAKPGFSSGFNFGTGATGSTGFGSTLGGGTGTAGFGSALGGGMATLGTATATSQAQSTQHLLALASSPYGDNPLFWNVRQQNKEKREDVLKPTNPNAQKAVMASANQYKVSPRPAARIKPKSLHGLMNGSKTQLFDGLEEEDFSFGDDTFVPRKSIKKLVLRNKSGNKSTSASSSFYSDAAADVTLNESSNRSNPVTHTSLITKPLNASQRAEMSIDNEAEAVVHNNDRTPVHKPPPVMQLSSYDDSPTPINPGPAAVNISHTPESNNNKLGAADTTSFLDTSDLDGSCWVVDSSTPHPTGVKLTRPGYYTIPTLDDMTEFMDENGNVFVEDFTVGRVGYGNVFFPGTTNVAGMNLDELVHFRRKEVVVYPDDDKKPPLGEGLNKKAEVTLDCVWPTDKSTRTPIKSPERLKVLSYSDKIEETTSKIGAKFIDYRPETGSWVFQVNHFSKYGLLDDSDEEDITDPKKAVQQAKDDLLIQKLKGQTQQQIQQKDMTKKGKTAQGLNFFTSDAGQNLSETILSEKEMYMEKEYGDEMLLEEDSYVMHETEDLHMKKRFHEDGMDASLDSKYLAASMGVSARNIQGMKASFFGEESVPVIPKKMKEYGQGEMDYYEDIQQMWKKTGSGLFGAFKHPGSLSLPQSPAFSDKEGYEPVSFPKAGLLDIGVSKDVLRPTPQTFFQPPVMEHKLLPSGLKPEDIPPRILGTRVRHNIIHPRDSILYRNQTSLLDTGCYMGRSFRVGWGPTWSMVHSGFPIGIQDEETSEITILPSNRGRVKPLPRLKSWQAIVEQLQVYDYMTQRNQAILKQQEDLLDIQLDHSRITIEDGSPLIVPEPGVDGLHKLVDAVQKDDLGLGVDKAVQEQSKMVLDLCVALWGNLPDAEDLDKDDIYVERQLRREAVSKWLSDTSSSRVASEMEAAPVISPEGCLKAVFSKLTVREISEACMLAQRGRDHRMALLMAQALTGQVFRQLVTAQLDKWAELDACQFVNDQRLKIYCLLAGQLVWATKDMEINTCEGLDWKRALALHLWYKCLPGTSVQQALTQYQKGFQGTQHSQAYCSSPRPPYLEGVTLESGEEKIFDTAYHLLCLFADEKYPLEALLSPSSSTPSHLDYRLSWHLLQTLESVGYRHLSPDCRASIHISFASQLEALGLWQWSAFVLLHIPHADQRQKATQNLLQRHLEVGEELTDREIFLIDKLQVPTQWLHQAKAVRAGHEGKYEAEARHWLIAEKYNKSHSVVIKHIAPDAIVNDEHEYLRSFLEEMSPRERSLGILGWSNNGKVFLDFINIKARLEQLRQQQPTQYDLEEMEPSVLSLCTRVKSLTCNNAKDRLCQAEMAKTAASLLRTFLELQGKPSVKILTQHIPDMPMPEDYTLQELQAISRATLMELV